jgi:3-oxoadipate enol-lactonase
VPVCEQSDVSTYYEFFGEGRRVLFFNGSGATLETSSLLIAALSAHCEVLAHDQRGLGRTTVPPGPYNMAQYARDGAALLDHVGWDRCAVVGISFGGMVAQEFAVTWPERVEKLVLMCTSAGGDAGSSYPLHELGNLPTDERAQKITELTDTRFTPEWLASHPRDARMVSMRAEQAAVPKSEEVLRGERLQLQARIGHDVADRLHLVTAPTLVTAGRFDGIAPVANSQEIVSRIPSAELRIYEGGHLFTAQDPNALADISEFLIAD